MDDLNPITRTERLLDGEDLTPTNREEMFIKRIYDKTQAIPEPVNRKEYFLKKAGEASGDVTVVPLSVSANGTYSEAGKAYSPVTVEVAPPEDSYQLKSIATPTSLATFEASEMPMPSLKVSVEAQQDLHGYDKPWVGGAGYNKWDEEWDLGGIDPSTGQDVSGNLVRSKNYIAVSADTTYYFKGVGRVFFYDNQKNYISRLDRDNNAFTTPNNCKYIRFRMDSSYGTTYNNDISINYPSSVTTYSPYSNICPISGWDNAKITDCGNNLLTNGTNTENGYKYHYYLDSLGNEESNSNYNISEYVKVNAGNTYTYGSYPNTSGGRISICFYDENKNFISGVAIGNGTATAVAPNNARYFRASYESELNESYKFIVVNGSTKPTAYEPYNGVTITISLGQTVYGGEVDVVNGVLRITWKSVDMGSLTWSYSPTYTRFSSTGVQDEIKSGNNQDEVMCSCYGNVANEDMNAFKTTSGLIMVKDSNYTDTTAFKQSVTGQQFVYMLETPIIIPLTPSLIKSLNGTNNLSVDCGDVIEGEYFKALGGE